MTSNSQSTKSLGQVAYEAYLADQLTRLDQSGHSLDDWSETGDHDAWQSAAEAVAQYCAWNPNAAERKVIEAAKAYKHGWHNGQNMDVLRDALFEALQGVE